MVEIGLVTAEILLTLSLCIGGGGGWIRVIFVSHPTFELSWGWVGVVTIQNALLKHIENYSEAAGIFGANIHFLEHPLTLISTTYFLNYLAGGQSPPTWNPHVLIGLVKSVLTAKGWGKKIH